MVAGARKCGGDKLAGYQNDRKEWKENTKSQNMVPNLEGLLLTEVL